MGLPTVYVNPGSVQQINTLQNGGTNTGANSHPFISVACDNWIVSQVSVGTTATLLLSARGTGRIGAVITNIGSVSVFVGGSGVTTTNGALLLGSAGSAKVISFNGAIYGIVASGSQTVTVEEYY